MSRDIAAPGRRRGRAAAALAAASAVAQLLAGCSFLGGLSTSRPVSVAALTVTSPVFGQHVQVPRRYTCHGIGQSPPLYWSGAPQDAKSFAIIVDDSLAPITPFVNWIVFDVSPATTVLLPGQLPAGARQAANSLGTARYVPLCPASRRHLYRFTVYALNAVLRMPAGSALRETWMVIAAHVIAVGRLTAYAAP